MTQITQAVSLSLIGSALVAVGLSLWNQSRSRANSGATAVADWMGLILAVILVGLPGAAWRWGGLSLPAMSGTSGSAVNLDRLIAWEFLLTPLRAWALVLIQLNAVFGIHKSPRDRVIEGGERLEAGDTAARTARFFAILFALTANPEHALSLLLSLMVCLAATGTLNGEPPGRIRGRDSARSFWSRCVAQTIVLGIPSIWLRQFWAGAAQTEPESWDIAMQASAFLTVLLVTPLIPLFPRGAWLIVEQRDEGRATSMWSGCVLPVAFILVTEGVLAGARNPSPVITVFLGWTALTSATALLIQWSHPDRAVRSRACGVLIVASLFGLLTARQASVEAIAILLLLPWILMANDSARSPGRIGWSSRSGEFMVCLTLLVESSVWLGLNIPAGPHFQVGHPMTSGRSDGILALTFLGMNLAALTAFVRDIDWGSGGRGLRQRKPGDVTGGDQDPDHGCQPVEFEPPAWLSGMPLLLLILLGLQNQAGLGRFVASIRNLSIDRIAMLLGVMLSPLVIAFSIRKVRTAPGHLALPESSGTASLAKLLADPGHQILGDLKHSCAQVVGLVWDASRILIRQSRHGLSRVLACVREQCVASMDSDAQEQLGLVTVLILLVLSFLLAGAH